MFESRKPDHFSLGRIVVTPGALRAIEDSGQSPEEFLARHHSKDWGELSDEDRRGVWWSSAELAHIWHSR
jgi:hypothetical protein